MYKKMQCKAFTFNHTCVIEPAPARHSKNKFFLCSRLLAAFTFQFTCSSCNVA